MLIYFVLLEKLSAQVKEIEIESVRTYKEFSNSINLTTHMKPEVFVLYVTETLEPQPTRTPAWGCGGECQWEE